MIIFFSWIGKKWNGWFIFESTIHEKVCKFIKHEWTSMEMWENSLFGFQQQNFPKKLLDKLSNSFK